VTVLDAGIVGHCSFEIDRSVASFVCVAPGCYLGMSDPNTIGSLNVFYDAIAAGQIAGISKCPISRVIGPRDAIPVQAAIEVVGCPTHEMPQIHGDLSAIVTRKKVAGMEVASLLGLLFWLLNRASSSFCRSLARPLFSAASNAFMVGP
jgi:hypothetical protein